MSPAPPTGKRGTVFIVDDDPSVPKALARLIGAAGYQVEIFASAAAYLRRAPFSGVGCILLDLRMPEMDGFQLQLALAHNAAALPIIFLTGHGDIPSSVQAIKRGAVDFLTKPVDERDLLQAIDNAMHIRSQMIGRQTRFNELTPREVDVMRCVIAGMLNKQIAGTLGIAEKTVKVHRGRMMAKVGVPSVAELARLCQEAGIAPITSGT